MPDWVPERIRCILELRDRDGLSVAAVARTLGLTRKRVAELERDGRVLLAGGRDTPAAVYHHERFG